MNPNVACEGRLASAVCRRFQPVSTMKYHSFIILAAAVVAASPTGAVAGNSQPTLLGWNNLGMHCMDHRFIRLQATR
jgi:hypothetical protein